MQLGLELKELITNLIPEFEHNSTQSYQPVLIDIEDKKILYYTVVSSEKALKNVGATDKELVTLQKNLLKIAEDTKYKVHAAGSIINFFTKPIRTCSVPTR